MKEGRCADMTTSNERKLKDNIQKNLNFYRKKAKLTQKDLADRLGIGATTVSGWERGAYTPDVDTLLLICNMLDVSFGDMCGIESTSSDFSLSAEEKNFLQTYRQLNPQGQRKLLERAEELRDLGYIAKGDAAKMA